ncbi:MAG: hypothetical protein HYX20_00540 [Candidatus Yanofskybacteria bacterium]|nr:hypothetical protein [Candidatus Yanofskybacteria bacterium]
MSLSKLYKFVKQYQSDIILAIAIVLISITAFNLGKISAYQQKKTPITITEPENKLQDLGSSQKQKNNPLNTKPSALNPNSPVVASKNSTSKIYHFPWCPSVSKIADKNKLTFSTEAAAISAGYTLAGNCTR